jgi:hypothetical protein
MRERRIRNKKHKTNESRHKMNSKHHFAESGVVVTVAEGKEAMAHHSATCVKMQDTHKRLLF